MYLPRSRRKEGQPEGPVACFKALLTNEDDVRNELFVDGNEASSARVLEVFTARGEQRARPRPRPGALEEGVVVGASYSIRATHADYLCDEFQRRFDAAAFDGQWTTRRRRALDPGLLRRHPEGRRRVDGQRHY